MLSPGTQEHSPKITSPGSKRWSLFIASGQNFKKVNNFHQSMTVVSSPEQFFAPLFSSLLSSSWPPWPSFPSGVSWESCSWPEGIHFEGVQKDRPVKECERHVICNMFCVYEVDGEDECEFGDGIVWLLCQTMTYKIIFILFSPELFCGGGFQDFWQRFQRNSFSWSEFLCLQIDYYLQD